MASVAVTGASGFIGRRLIERLCRDGTTVKALMRRRQVLVDVDQDSLVTVQGALGDDRSIESLIDGVDVVVHLAGCIKAKNRDGFFEVNEAGSRHLVKLAAARQKPPKIILVSSLAAREPKLSSYAASKRAGEDALITLGDHLPWTILRPPAVYGPGDRETLAFFKSTNCGIGAMLGDREARFSLIHVDDLTSAIAHIQDPAIADHAVLELDDGHEGGHSWASMIDAAERAYDKKAIKIPIPAILLFALGYANVALGLLPGYTPMLTAEKARELRHRDWVADSRLIQSKTGWRPAISLDRGFPATIDWYRLHSWL